MQKSSQSAPGEPENTTTVCGRALYFGCLLAFPAGILLAAAGILSARIDRVLNGGGILLLAWGVRSWLQRRGEWDAAGAAFDAFGGSEPAEEEDERTTHLLHLLQQRDELETRRGRADFDPWALQEIRRDIQTTIERDVALTRFFQTYERHKRMS